MRLADVLRSRLLWAVAIVAALVGAYALVGFKVAPGFVRSKAIEFVRESYGRELAIGAVRIDPFKLQAEIRDVALPDADGQPMLAFRRLFVDVELASLWQRTLILKDVDFEAPRMNAVIRPDGAINLLDLVPPDEPDEPESPPPPVWLQSLVVDGGSIEIHDLARPRPFHHRFTPVEFKLEDFRTTPAGGGFALTARSGTGETFDWKGRVTLAPQFASQGEVAMGHLQATRVSEYLGDALPFALTSGQIDLSAKYQFALGKELDLKLRLPKMEFTGLALRARNADADWVKVPSLVLTDTAVALPEQTVKIANVTVADVTAQAWILPDGSVNLAELFEPAPAGPAEVPAAEPAAARAAESGEQAANLPAVVRKTELPNPWHVEVASVDVVRAAVDFEDRMQEPVKKFALAPVNVHVKSASLDLSRPLPVKVDAVINGHAAFDAEGTMTPDPLAADLGIRLAKARMTILQPYVLPLADLTIKGGELGVEGRVKLDPADAPGPNLSFDGDVTIAGFSSVDNAQRKELVEFREVKVARLHYAMGPDAVNIERITVAEPYARVIIDPERVINIAAVLDPEGTAQALAERRAAAAAEAQLTAAEKRQREREREAAERRAAKARKAGKAPPAPALAALPEEGTPIRIREVRVDGGTLDFTDLSIRPNFSAKVTNLDGTLSALSSDPASHAKVDLKGQVGPYSPVTIAGEIQPFSYERFTDVGLRFENISLPIFNPYSGEYAGYSIAKGKLTTDLHYRIQERKLDAEHKVRIDQLEWGEPTAAKGEATLPVKFVTALLKDSDGVIELDIPVSGTLDDPTFRIGPIIWQIVKNLLTKVVTAPFKLLGALFQGAEEAQFVDFAPGRADLDAQAVERLAALAKSLVQKPGIRLDVPIGTLAELDGPALANAAYEQQRAAALAATKLEGKYDSAAPPFESLEPQDRIAVLATLLRQQTGAESQVPEPPAPPEGTSRDAAKALRQSATLDYLEKETRARAAAPEADLGKLGEDRAAAVQRALLEGTQLEPARVFLNKAGKVTPQDGKVRLELGLQ